MSYDPTVAARFRDLDEQAAAAEQTPPAGRSFAGWFEGWATACLSLLQRTFGGDSPYYTNFRQKYEQSYITVLGEDSSDSSAHDKLESCAPIFHAAVLEYESQPHAASSATQEGSTPSKASSVRRRPASTMERSPQEKISPAKGLSTLETGPTSPTPTPYVGQLLGAVTGFLLGVLGNLTATWFQQDVLRNTFTPVSLLVILACTILGLFIGVWLRRPLAGLPKAFYWVVVLLVTGNLLLAVILAGREAKPPTVYFVVDTTARMAPLFASLRPAVQAAAAGIPRQARVGLRLYGGAVSGSSGCTDTRQMLPPQVAANPGATLDAALAEVNPGGDGSLTGAVLDAIYDDLAQQEGPVRLIVITAGTNLLCDPQSGGILESRAKDVRANVDLLVISLGDADLQDTAVLKGYAQAFQGNYVALAAVADLPQAITETSYYGSTYFLNSLTPTASP